MDKSQSESFGYDVGMFVCRYDCVFVYLCIGMIVCWYDCGLV